MNPLQTLYTNAIARDGDGAIDAERVEWPVEIPLLRTIETGKRTIETVTLREPRALDIETCWKRSGEMTRMVHLVSTLAEMSPDEVRRLKSVDFMRAVRVVGAFL